MLELAFANIDDQIKTRKEKTNNNYNKPLNKQRHRPRISRNLCLWRTRISRTSMFGCSWWLVPRRRAAGEHLAPPRGLPPKVDFRLAQHTHTPTHPLWPVPLAAPTPSSVRPRDDATSPVTRGQVEISPILIEPEQ